MTRGLARQFWTEAKSFWGEAFAWRGAATPRVLPPVAVFGVIATLVYAASRIGPYIGIPIAAHEIAGALLGLILVVRTNAGYDRWWEGRRLWGGIVNQTRILASIVLTYGPNDPGWRGRDHPLDDRVRTRRPAWPARSARDCPRSSPCSDERSADRIAASVNMPNAVAGEIGRLLREAHRSGEFDGLAFSGAEPQRTTLIATSATASESS